MARLQDFPTVSPTSSDKLLVVQSQSQGLVPYGSKLDSANPTGTGSLSLNRKANTTTGGSSVAIGNTVTASGSASIATGYNTTASGNYSTAMGRGTEASGTNGAFAVGFETKASGQSAHASGEGTEASRRAQNVFGQYNVADTGGSGSTTRGTYIEIVGKGTADNARSNARTLDWNGNEVLAGDLTINGSTSVGTALSVQNVSITVDTTKVSGTITCKKVGHIAYVSLYNVAFTSSGNNQSNLVTGLPKALMQPTITSFGGDDASKTQTINTNGDTLWINANGTSLNGHISASTYNLKHYVLFSYPCE